MELVVPGVVFSIVGVGLLLLRKSAAVALSLISCPAGFFLIRSWPEVSLPFNLVNALFGAAAFIPLLVLILFRKSFKGW